MPLTRPAWAAPRAGTQRLLSSGDLAREATRYALKPKLGAALRLFATLLGKAPVDQECIILTGDGPRHRALRRAAVSQGARLANRGDECPPRVRTRDL